MDRVYAFTDEYGGFGWNLVNPTVSSNYIITAIIVKESDLETFTAQSEAIRKKIFSSRRNEIFKSWKEPSSSAVDS